MSRNRSIPTSEASKGRNYSESDYSKGSVAQLESVPSRHVHIASEAIVEGSAVEIIDWDGPNDPENPFNWSVRYKWIATLTTCFISVLTGIPAGAYGTASEQMSRLWHIDETKFPYLSFALVSWNMGAAIFPLIFVPLTDSTGRMPGYFVSYIIFLIFLIPSATAPNFATMVVTRFFGGGASSVAINIVGGTITDIWKGDKDRSLPMSIFGMTSVVGIALGPFIGGAIQKGLNWRWIYWIQLIVDAALLPLFYCILRETRGDVILAKRAKKLRKQGRENAYAKSELNQPSILQSLKLSFMRPTKMLATELVVSSFTIWVSFAWGILFLFQSSIPIVFREIYGYDTFQTTLVQLALPVGAILATIVNPIQDRLYLKSAKRNLERPDAYEKYAASALSAASMGRNVFGAFLPLATPALYEKLGPKWASSLLGFIGLVLSGVPVLLLAFGESIRARSPFMLDATYDDEESVERRASIASRYTAERKPSAVIPWSTVRAV